MEDYYVHMRDGFIIPVQNATAQATRRTHDQLFQYTDLIIMPNASNHQDVTAIDVTMNASATGFVYFDDGVKFEKDVQRVEMFYKFVDSDTGASATKAQIIFNTTGTYANADKNVTNQQLGTITILNPMRDPVPTQGAAAARGAIASVEGWPVKGGAKFALNYEYVGKDAATQILLISSKDATHHSIGDIAHIDITYTKTEE